MPNLTRLPLPISEKWEWQMQGLCRGMGSDLFFHPEGERLVKRAARDRLAKAVCAQCPVISECAAHALRVQEPYGVWGGMTEEERDALIHGLAA